MNLHTHTHTNCTQMNLQNILFTQEGSLIALSSPFSALPTNVTSILIAITIDEFFLVLRIRKYLRRKERKKVKLLSHVRLFATPWTIACQAPPSMGFSRQEYWNGLPFPSPGESSQPRDQTQVSCIAGRFFTAEVPGKPGFAKVSDSVGDLALEAGLAHRCQRCKSAPGFLMQMVAMWPWTKHWLL